MTPRKKPEEKRKPGPPPNPLTVHGGKAVRLILTEEEHEMVWDAAYQQKIRMAHFARQAVVEAAKKFLGKPPVPTRRRSE